LEIIVNSWGALDLKSRAFLVKRIGIAMFCSDLVFGIVFVNKSCV